MPEPFNLTQSILGEVEQSLTPDSAETADVTVTEQDKPGTPSETDQPSDAVENGEQSLNDTADHEGKKLPTHVKYDDFQEQVHRRQTLEQELATERLERSAVSKGFESHAQYQQYDELAKQEINPFTALPYTGVDEYQAVQREIVDQQERQKAFEREQDEARERYVAEYGDEFGKRLADLESRTARAEFTATQATQANARLANERVISDFEADFKDAGADLAPRLRNHLLGQPPNVVKGMLDDLRATFAPLKMTPEKQKALEEAAIQKYRGQKAQDKERVGATPETDRGQPVHSGQKQDLKAIAAAGMSRILGVR